MKRLTIGILSLVTVLGIGAGIAHAGAWRSTQEVDVNPTTREARGVMRDARMSDDGVQYIGCTVRHIGSNEFPWVSCAARDAEGDTLTCSGSFEHQGLALANLRPESLLSFSATGTGRCMEISVTNDSRYLAGPFNYTVMGTDDRMR